MARALRSPLRGAARALVFDFDGTILDTEMPVYRAWADLYERHGVELDLVRWQTTIGGNEDPDHFANLEAIVGTVDPSLRDWRRARRDELLHGEEIRPGVVRWLDDAEVLRIPVGIASSSPIDWVEDHLDRIGLLDRFACFACCNEIIPAKPDPTSYRLACETLHADPKRSIAVEDSPHGVAAAKDAGLFVVATPHDLTSSLDLSRADIVVDSLEQLRLADLVVELRAVRRGESEWLYALHKAAFRDRVEELFGAWDEVDQRTQWARRDPNATIEVITVDGRGVGAVHTKIGDTFEVDLIEVHPDVQRAGLGGAVLRQLITRAAPLDMTLRTHKGNPALQLYQRVGFEGVGETDTHHLLRRTNVQNGRRPATS